MDWNHVTAAEVLSALREVRDHSFQEPMAIDRDGSRTHVSSLALLQDFWRTLQTLVSGGVEVAAAAAMGGAAAVALLGAAIAQEVGGARQELGLLLPRELCAGAPGEISDVKQEECVPTLATAAAADLDRMVAANCLIKTSLCYPLSGVHAGAAGAATDGSACSRGLLAGASVSQ